MFSVLGNKEIGGRTGTILEGESGVNDLVGIAPMIGMIEPAQDADATLLVVVEEFVLEDVDRGSPSACSPPLRSGLYSASRSRTPGLYPLRRLPRQASSTGRPRLRTAPASSPSSWREWRSATRTSRFATRSSGSTPRLASLAEAVVFAALGLTIDLAELLSSTRPRGPGPRGDSGRRCPAAGGRPAPPRTTSLRRNERLFVIWGGLRGAVPILLAAFALLAAVDDAERVYDIVFVVVAFSVIVQGSSIPFVARRLRIPMRTI